MTIVEARTEPGQERVGPATAKEEPRLYVELIPTVATIALAALVLWDASFPARLWLLAAFAGFIGLAVVLVWAMVIVDRARRGWPVSRRRRYALIASLPTIVVLTGLLYFSPIPSLARLNLSRSALEALAATGTEDPSGTTVGLYEVEAFERTAGGFEFATNASFLLDCGLAYSPGRVPGPSIESTSLFGRRGYEHLDGPWYVWCEEWD